MNVIRSGSQPSTQAAVEHFTGTARVDHLVSPPPPARVKAAYVTFEPGARTAWHRHPLGQTLVITAGCGWVQGEGQNIQVVHAGDVVWIAPGESHWHGASSTTAMTHLAITEHVDGKSVDWMERVTDAQYLTHQSN